MTALLTMSGVHKTFGGVVALDSVDFEVGAGEVHGLLGGNGAGKTTLMNVLYGLYRADSGAIELRGRPLEIRHPRDAIDAGIGMVHQTFLQVDSYDVTENVVLGTPTGGRWKMDLGPARARVVELSARFGLTVDPDAIVGDLPVGVRQRVEILKALYRGAEVLVLDEPTTNLTPQEVDDLFSSLRTIVDEGMAVILITHKIRETMAVCDRMTIMREGRKVATVERAATTADDLAAAMIGEQPDEGDAFLAVATGTASTTELVEDRDAEEHAVLVRVEELDVANDHGAQVVHGVNVTVGRGEVVGVAGVAGNGQVELVEALAGVRPFVGTVEIDGTVMAGRLTARWLTSGVVYVPEDRHRDGILTTSSITENLVLGAQRSARFRRGRLLDWARARSVAATAIRDYSIQASGPNAICGQLSGGNIQRVILARAFARSPALLILHNPTRGLDIRSTQFVYEQVRSAAARGCAVLIVSEDLDELVTLADRALVLYDGRIVGERRAGAVDPYEMGRLMVGVAAGQ